MIINGKKVTGLYKYNSEAIYTQGDLVYKDSTLYVAETEVTGIDPSDEEMSVGKYHIYLGDKCVSLDDYLNYEKTEDSKLNKYIPASLLPVILNHYLTGVTEKGVIESINDSYKSDTKTTADEILDNDNINHAIYSVDRDLEGLPVDLYSSESGRINGEKLILKQYTYLEKSFEDLVQVSRRVRVQELIDHSQYMVWYRYKKIDEVNSSPSQWKSITLNSTNIHDNILRLANEYKSRINVLQETLINLKKNFRFRSIEIPKLKSNSFSIPKEYSKSKMTIAVQLKSGNGIYKIINFTINLSSSINKYESDGVYLSFDSEYIKIFEDRNMSILHRKAVINDIYVHEYYE